jgi:hypothetical protein
MMLYDLYDRAARLYAWGDKTPAKQRTHFPADTGHIVVRAQGACPAAVAVLAWEHVARAAEKGGVMAAVRPPICTPKGKQGSKWGLAKN